MDQNLMDKLLSKRIPAIKFATVFLTFVSVAGCKSMVACMGGFGTCDFYQSPTTGNVDNSVVMLGDSGFDYGEGYGAVPKQLTEITSSIFHDYSVSNKTTDHIFNVQLPKLVDDQSSGVVQPRTVIATGIANNIRASCSQKSGSNINTTVATLTPECQADISSGLLGGKNSKGKDVKGVRNIIEELDNIQKFPMIGRILWVGPVSVDEGLVSLEVFNFVNQRLMGECSRSERCRFINSSTLWLPQDVVADSKKYFFDGYHVTKWAAGEVAHLIVSEMGGN